LWEISNTGVRTKDIFERSIANLHETVVSTILRDCAARAGLAIDIMDRNLYERANDCRWWALSTAIQTVLTQSPAEAAARLTPILSTINGLYTVYSNLILFDATGQVVAVSAEGIPHWSAVCWRRVGGPHAGPGQPPGLLRFGLHAHAPVWRASNLHLLCRSA
jgi:hypothetical protein